MTQEQMILLREKSLREMRKFYYSISDIAKAIGVSTDLIKRRLKEYNIPIRLKRKRK